MNVLVAAPHPDDDLIGCGGSLIKHVKKGHQVAIVYMTSGDSGSLDRTKKELAEIREREAADAARTLGVTDLTFFRNDDGYLEYNRKNLVDLVCLVRKKRPTVIYIPHRQENHPDHQQTHDLFIEAIRRARGPWFQECGGEPWTVGNILAYEVWTPLQKASYTEDITEFMELKLEALRKHASQLRDIAYDEATRSLNRYRGITTGVGQYCECFEVISIHSLI